MKKYGCILLLAFLLQSAQAQPPMFETYMFNSTSLNAPFSNSNNSGNTKVQFLLSNADLRGPASGTINKIFFYLINGTTACTLNGLTIKMGQTSTATFSSATASMFTGLTTVYATTSYGFSMSQGWLGFTLSTPFSYSNSQQLIVEVSCTSISGGGFNLNASTTSTGNIAIVGTGSTATNGNGSWTINKIPLIGLNFTPTVAPTASFSLFDTIGGVFSSIRTVNSSTGFPTSYTWTFNPVYIGMRGWGPNSFSTAPNLRNPDLFLLDVGTFDVCLKVSNAYGADSVCKTNHVRVLDSYQMCTGGGDTVSTYAEGLVYDAGGPTAPYQPSLVGNCNGGFHIAAATPCLDTMELKIEAFKMRTGDSVTIRNGGNASAPILKKLGGTNLPLAWRTWVATSRHFFLQTSAVPASGSGDSGYAIRWYPWRNTPTTPSTAFTVGSLTSSSMQISWTKGNGRRRIVIARSGIPVATMPAERTVYTANSQFGLGSSFGGGYVVYNDTGNSVTVTGLFPYQSCYFAVIEYNGDSCRTAYLTSAYLTANASSLPVKWLSFTAKKIGS